LYIWQAPTEDAEGKHLTLLYAGGPSQGDVRHLLYENGQYRLMIETARQEMTSKRKHTSNEYDVKEVDNHTVTSVVPRPVKRQRFTVASVSNAQDDIQADEEVRTLNRTSFTSSLISSVSSPVRASSRNSVISSVSSLGSENSINEPINSQASIDLFPIEPDDADAIEIPSTPEPIVVAPLPANNSDEELTEDEGMPVTSQGSVIF